MLDSLPSTNAPEDWDKAIPKIVPLPAIHDSRGTLGYIQTGLNCPFPIRRIYFMYDMTVGVERGGHAHYRALRQLVTMSGQVLVRLETADGLTEHRLDSRCSSLLVPAQAWITYIPLSPDSVLVALASEPYDEADYIRDYAAFKKSLSQTPNTAN